MTPKEKAKNLVNKYYLMFPDTSYDVAIQCALIAVKEVLLHEKNNHSVSDKLTDYWEEVKQEILAL